MMRHEIVYASAFVAAAAAGTGVALGLVAAARGDTNGAPGFSKALSRLGATVGGGMTAGVAVLAGTAAVTALTVYEGATRTEALRG